MNKQEARIMGMDFGEVRIGIALSDPLQIFAYPFKTLRNDDKLWLEIENIVSEMKVIRLILGLPSDSQKSSAAMKIKVEKFKIEFEKRTKIPVIFWDEEYTSVIAKERVIESVTKKSKRKNKSLIDTNAAAIILQEYLDSH